jgi:hypothetical protein
MLSGQIDYAGLPIVVEILGIQDVEMLVCQLMVIRDQKHE